MARSTADVTVTLANKLAELEQVGEVIEHEREAGKVAFRVKESISSARIDRLVPDGWTVDTVVTPRKYTNSYIRKE